MKGGRMIYRNSKEINALSYNSRNIVRIMHNGKCVYNACNTIVGTVPLTFRNGSEIINQYQIWGDIQQNGTPSPENPVEVKGVGELVKNGEYSGKYEISVAVKNGNNESILTSIYLPQPLFKSDYIKKDKSNSMIHRERGFKIFDGSDDENFYLADTNSKNWERYPLGIYISDISDGGDRLVYCDKIFCAVTDSEFESGDITVRKGYKSKIIWFFVPFGMLGDESLNIGTAVKKFKLWLSENPVTVYYSLAEPVEQLVELPKISAIKGENIVDINTIVKPEKISLTYRR